MTRLTTTTDAVPIPARHTAANEVFATTRPALTTYDVRQPPPTQRQPLTDLVVPRTQDELDEYVAAASVRGGPSTRSSGRARLFGSACSKLDSLCSSLDSSHSCSSRLSRTGAHSREATYRSMPTYKTRAAFNSPEGMDVSGGGVPPLGYGSSSRSGGAPR
jgi:hypothetical protein